MSLYGHAQSFPCSYFEGLKSLKAHLLLLKLPKAAFLTKKSTLMLLCVWVRVCLCADLAKFAESVSFETRQPDSLTLAATGWHRDTPAAVKLILAHEYWIISLICSVTLAVSDLSRLHTHTQITHWICISHSLAPTKWSQAQRCLKIPQKWRKLPSKYRISINNHFVTHAHTVTLNT